MFFGLLTLFNSQIIQLYFIVSHSFATVRQVKA